MGVKAFPGPGDRRQRDTFPTLIRSHKRQCQHWRLSVDPDDRTVTCLDCHAQLEPGTALLILADRLEAYEAEIYERQQEIEKLRTRAKPFRVAKMLENIWRTVGWNPLCPHCETPLRLEDLTRADGQPHVKRERE